MTECANGTRATGLWRRPCRVELRPQNAAGPWGPHWEETCAAAKSLQACPTLCDPIDGSLPGSPVPGILQARTLEWVAISFSNAWKWKVKVKSPSHVWLLATPWTAAYQAPPSMGFSRKSIGVGCHCLLQRVLYTSSHWSLTSDRLSWRSENEESIDASFQSGGPGGTTEQGGEQWGVAQRDKQRHLAQGRSKPTAF